VSVLNEMCSKHRWHPPRFELMDEVGPDHHKTFRFKVQFNALRKKMKTFHFTSFHLLCVCVLILLT